MALPFGTFSIKRGRHSGILVPSPGYNKEHGKYIEDIALYFAFKDHLDMLLSYDFYEKSGWRTRFDIDYVKQLIIDNSDNYLIFQDDIMKYIEQLAPKDYAFSSIGKNLYNKGDNIVSQNAKFLNIHEGEGGVVSNGLRAPGAYRPDLVDPNAEATGLKWGLSMTSYQGGAGLQRFIIQYH